MSQLRGTQSTSCHEISSNYFISWTDKNTEFDNSAMLVSHVNHTLCVCFYFDMRRGRGALNCKNLCSYMNENDSCHTSGQISVYVCKGGGERLCTLSRTAHTHIHICTRIHGLIMCVWGGGREVRRSGVAKYRVSEQEDIGEHGCPLRFCELIVYSETNSFRGIV